MDSNMSPEPPQFFKIIHSEITHQERLRIPPKFVKIYGKNLSNRVYLNVPNGKQWVVNLVQENGYVWLADGWKEFADHYSVSVNHFLIFIYRNDSVFEVLIFDESASEIQYPSPKSLPQHKRKCEFDEIQYPSPKSLPQHKRKCEFDDSASKKKQVNKGERALEKAESFRSENPFFMTKINKGFQKCNQIVPASFRVEHFKNIEKGTLVELTAAVENKKWLIVYDSKYHKLTKGWCGFARENHLEVGDVCVFELTKKNKNFFDVTVFRARKK